MGPRSRLPLSPSMEARLSDDTSTSQDSLVSTGSNQELKTQLDTTLAEVEAITQELEKKKLPKHVKQKSSVVESLNAEMDASISPPQHQQAPPKPRRASRDFVELQSNQRRASQQNDIVNNAKTVETSKMIGGETGARMRDPTKKYSSETAPKVTPRSSVPGKKESTSSGSSNSPLITQSSWASRDQGLNTTSAAASARALKNSRVTSPKPKQSSSSISDTQAKNGGEEKAPLSTVETRKASITSQQNDNSSNGDVRSISNSRDLWQRRASTQSNTHAADSQERKQSYDSSNMSISVGSAQEAGLGGGGVGPNPVSAAFQQSAALQRGGFRNNRDFWEQRGAMRQKQTPDLVLDLPVSSLSTSPNRTQSASPPSSASVGAVPSANTAAVAPLPRPRKSISPSNNPAANNESDDKDQTPAKNVKPSARPRQL